MIGCLWPALGNRCGPFFMDFVRKGHVPANLYSLIPVYPYCREILPDFFVDAMLRGSACRL